MGYQEKVRDRLKSDGIRSAQRGNLWERVVSAYDRGMAEEVVRELDAVVKPLADQVDELLGRLRERL